MRLTNKLNLPDAIVSAIASNPKMMDCLIWPRGRTTAGYGVVSIGKRQREYVHRLVVRVLHNGGEALPVGAEVCHRCSNPSCFNPNHLYIGTKSTNMRDASRLRRLYGQRDDRSGVRSNSAHFTMEQVTRMRCLRHIGGQKLRTIAREFGTAPSTVHLIVKSKSYARCA